MTQQDALTVGDYEEVLADHRRLVRELDQAINGSNAAEQASLCDIVAQVKRQGLVAEQDESEILKDARTLAKLAHGHHAKDCSFADPLPTGQGTWGCSCGLDSIVLDGELLKDYTRPAPKTYTESDIDVAIGAVDWANTSWQQAAVEAKKLVMRFVGSTVQMHPKRLSDDEVTEIMDNNGAGWWTKHNLEFDYHGFANALMDKLGVK